ncbi:DUF2254 domain-containing protein [Glaciecola sp. MH2013]|uniref:DUF2254 domain-containing protein n=1 Tax=Glaciecola sp. MH2013 TaxID=2785524 RepID=UPI00189D22EB|nr:DUF2254 domain-containing protein [Glaciecola sp. MH2013]MBF7073438.1 DUF2254 domain-containing protein [Glaciecola sp. MH2013]
MTTKHIKPAMLIRFFIKLKKASLALGGSFWFAPLVMLAVSIALALNLTIYSSVELSLLTLVGLNDLDAARGMIDMVASSAISVISIAFSMTLVALVMASSQFGPRIIRSFMESKKTQFTLGLFTSVYAFSLIIFTRLSEEGRAAYQVEAEQVYLGYPAFIVFFLAIICVIALIFFIHHVASSIQADNVVEGISESLLHDIKSLQNHHSAKRREDVSEKQGRALNTEESDFLEHDFVKRHALVHKKVFYAESSGYIQAIEYDGLANFALQHNAFVSLNSRAGKYLLCGSPILTVYASASVDKLTNADLNRFVELGPKRTALQDPEYAVNQLVEIALRALSPSMDDPYTAINCIDKIACAIGTFTANNLPNNYISDAKGTLRLRSCDESFDDIFANAFNQIRQAAVLRPAVLCHLLETFNALLVASQQAEHLIEPIARQTKALRELFLKRNELHAELDLASINSRLLQLDALPIDINHK